MGAAGGEPFRNIVGAFKHLHTANTNAVQFGNKPQNAAQVQSKPLVSPSAFANGDSYKAHSKH